MVRRQPKPAGVMVVAILQIVFGSLGFCVAAVNLSGLPQQLSAMSGQNLPPEQRPLSQTQIEEQVEKYVPHYHAILQASLGASAVLALLMIVSGIGLLRLQPWGRLLALVYAVLSILYTIASVAYQAVAVLPAMSSLTQEWAKSPNAQLRLASQFMSVGAIFGIVLGLFLMIYPIIVLVIMLLPSTRAAFRGQSLAAGPEDYRDAGWGADRPAAEE